MKQLFQIAEDPLYRCIFSPINSNMYLFVHDSQALVIDPCEDLQTIRELKSQGVHEILILLTHEHFDHISGVNEWREQFDKVKVLCSKPCAERIGDPRKNLSQYFLALFSMGREQAYQQVLQMQIPPYSCQTDDYFEGETTLLWNGHQIRLTETPGHSAGSICIVIDQTAVFTGDSLVQGAPVVTRLPGGSRQAYLNQTLPYLSSFCGENMAFPGHGEPEPLAELLRKEREYAAF